MIGRDLVLVVLTLILLAAIAGCGDSKPPAPPATRVIKGPLSLTPAAWRIQYSKNYPANPAAPWRIDMPLYNDDPQRCESDPACASLHYVTTTVGGSLGGTSIAMDFEVKTEGEIRFSANIKADPCQALATVRLFIQRGGDDDQSDFFRWWSNPAAKVLDEIGNTPAVLHVPLDPAAGWSSVFGHYAKDFPNEFKQTIASVANIGFTFGGCGFGHGVVALGSQGKASFTLTRYAIE